MLTLFLKAYAPDYCWCSAQDLYLMYETYTLDNDHPHSPSFDNFNVTLSKLKSEGYFQTKPSPYQTNNSRGKQYSDLYLRIK